MRIARLFPLSLVGVFALVVGVVRAEAQEGWVDVNIGVAQARETTFRSTYDDVLFLEPARFDVDYRLPRGASFDFGGGYMFTPIVGLGVSFTGTAHQDYALLSARVPHPLIANAYGQDSTETDAVFQRVEGAFNIQAMVVVANTGKVRARVFGGPSFFRVQQDLVSTFFYRQFWTILPTTNRIDITEFESNPKVEGTGTGFNVGGDVSVFFNRIVGLGAFGRYTSGTVTLDDSDFSGDRSLGVQTGGLQFGGGLRLRFGRR